MVPGAFVAHDSAREDRIEIIGDKGMICFSVFTYEPIGLHTEKEGKKSVSATRTCTATSYPSGSRPFIGKIYLFLRR